MLKRFSVGFATGYVFGARAGEKRYREIVNVAERLIQLPLVQRLVEDGRDMATEQGLRVLGNLRERARGLNDGRLHEADPYDEDEADSYDDDEEVYDDEEEEVHAR